MKIIRPYYKILTAIEEIHLKHIEYCTRISHRSEDKITDTSAQKLLKFVVMEKGDFSVIEHSMMTVEFVVDRGITHELVRHRLFSFTQESTRFVNYEKKMPPSFIYPQVGVGCKYCLDDELEPTLNYDETTYWHSINDGYEIKKYACSYDDRWLRAIDVVEKEYKELIKRKGWRPQEARSVFPNALASKVTVTGNLRNWRHILLMRTSAETHPQFKQVTIPLLKELQANIYIGWLFSDITPEQKQSEAMKSLR